MKKFIIALISLFVLFSCCPADNGRTEYQSTMGTGSSSSVKNTQKRSDISRYDVPWAKRIGYNHDYGCYVYSLESDGHKFVIYRETIIMVE